MRCRSDCAEVAVFVKASREVKEGTRYQSGEQFVHAIVEAVPDAQPVSTGSYGAQVWSSATLALPLPEQVRAGDVFVAMAARFKGKLGSSTLVGANAPHVGIVSDFDVRKKKLRVFEVVDGRLEQGGHHLDALKAGTVSVFRVLDRPAGN